MTGKLFEHLHEVDVQAQKILEQFIEQAEKNAPDKATQQMAWVGHMNNAKACAEEIILSEIIYI
jgi:EAL domain-containing protein (putative c-di-GMP-specific phosphodiesterase class I)